MLIGIMTEEGLYKEKRKVKIKEKEIISKHAEEKFVITGLTMGKHNNFVEIYRTRYWIEIFFPQIML